MDALLGRPVLEASELVKEYATDGTVSRALAGVSLEVPAGRFVSVMGPSGSGKSTLLHLLGGLDEPTSGTVLVGGQSLFDLSEVERTTLRRRQIGFVFQFFNLIPVLTAAENVALPAVVAGAKPATYDGDLEQALDIIGLRDHRHKLPSQLSGGQQQRVAIARALFMKPAVLLADEPTGNLDTTTGAEVLALLRRVQQDLGTTVVMVTHDPRAAATGDEVVMLVDGRVAGHLELAGDTDRRVAQVLQSIEGVELGRTTTPV